MIRCENFASGILISGGGSAFPQLSNLMLYKNQVLFFSLKEAYPLGVSSNECCGSLYLSP